MSNSTDNIIADLAKRDFIVFAGAGIPNGDGRPISWEELLQVFKEAEPDLDMPDVEEVLESEYPDYAQKAFDALRGQGRESRYFEILREKLRATNARCSIQQFDIIDTARHVVTTNFDDSFKNAMNRVLERGNHTSATQILPDFIQRYLELDYSVSYLHGNTNENFIVFKKDDYETYYPSQSQDNRVGSDNLEQFLRHLYEERTMVFIGVSFNDEYLLNAFKGFYDRVKQNDEINMERKVNYMPKLDQIRHYAFMSEDVGLKPVKRHRGVEYVLDEQDIEEYRRRKTELLAGLRINVVPYHEHVEWTDWLSDIRAGRREPSIVSEYEKDPSM